MDDLRGRPLGLEVLERLRGGAAKAVDRGVVVAGTGDVAVVRDEQAEQQALGEARVLQVVDEHVRVACGEPAAHVRLLAQQAERTQHQVAGVDRAGVAQHPVVGAEQLAELALARGSGALAEGGGPRGVVLARDQLVLQPVDPRDDRAEHGAGVAAKIVQAQRQVVDALQQHRQAVGRADRCHERVDARLGRLVAQQPDAQALERGDRRLLGGGPVEALLDALAHLVGGGRRVRQRQDGLRRRTVCHEPGEALGEQRGLAGARAADDEQWAAGMRHGLVLVGGEHLGN